MMILGGSYVCCKGLSKFAQREESPALTQNRSDQVSTADAMCLTGYQFVYHYIKKEEVYRPI